MGACAHIDPLPSLSFGSTAASIPQSVNEVSVDPLRGTTPPPWSRIATLTRLLEPSAPASRFGYGCGGAVGRQLDHRRAQTLAHLQS